MSSKNKASKAENQSKLAAGSKSTAADTPTPKEQAKTAKDDKAAAKAAGVVEVKEPGKIAKILDLFRSGKTNKEIEEAGFHKTTIAIQVAKYKKAHPDLYPPIVKAPKKTAAEKKAEKAALKTVAPTEAVGEAVEA
jgi:hypothetical protein